MQEEYKSLIKNQTWDMNLFRHRCVYRTKRTTYGHITIYKSMLVSKGFHQVHGTDYDETFAPIEKMESICLELSIATTKGWEVYQMDVKNAFLHSSLYEEIYMENPRGFM
jgi:hypothetical protein